jgi:hypothetical protein
LLQTSIIVLTIAQVFPTFTAFSDEFISYRQFPILSNFETPFEITRWEGKNISIDKTVKYTGKASMRVELNTDTYSGISLQYFEEDWRDYKYLYFSIFNPEPDSLSMTCRIHDKKHTNGIQAYEDRFNQGFVVNQGWNTIKMDLNDVRHAPHTREMDMDQIISIGIFATRLPNPRIVYIDDVKLSR